jgi:GH18 family chitinase
MNMKYPFIIFAVILSIFFDKVTYGQCTQEIVGYFLSDSYTDRTNLVNVSTIDYSKYTIINYSFFVPDANGKLSGSKPTADAVYLTTSSPATNQSYLIGKAKANGVKVLMSVGGQAGSSFFENLTGTTDPKIDTFVTSCATKVAQYGFDGIDLDWEGPDDNTEKAIFTKILQDLRTMLGSGKKLTAAVLPSDYWLGYIDWNAVIKNSGAPLDMVNVMTYNYFTITDTWYGTNKSDHNSPLYASTGTNDANLNVNHSFNTLTGTGSGQYSVPANKINLGLAFYGRSWQPCTNLNTAASSGTFGVTSYDNTLSPDLGGEHPYYSVLSKVNSGTYNWDNISKVPYLLYSATIGGSTKNVFLSYDNERSIEEKANYVKNTVDGSSNHLKGVLIWDITYDYIQTGGGAIAYTPLVDKVNSVFNRAVDDSKDYNSTRSPSSNPLPAYTGMTGYITAGAASVEVQTTTEVAFKAGTYIVLNPGFYAPSGSIFSAEINTLCHENPARMAFSPEPFDGNALSASESIRAYPNPTSSKLNLDLNFDTEKEMEVSVYNTLGKEVYGSNIGYNAMAHLEIDLSNEPAGMFIVKIKSGNDIHYKKVILSK